MKNASARFCAIKPPRIFSTFSTALDAIGVEHADDVAGLAEERIGHDEVGIARGEDRGDADIVVARKLRDRPERRDADAAAEHDDVAPGRIEPEADAERPDHIEVVALLQRREPARAAADAFVEKLDAAALAD